MGPRVWQIIIRGGAYGLALAVVGCDPMEPTDVDDEELADDSDEEDWRAWTCTTWVHDQENPITAALRCAGGFVAANYAHYHPDVRIACGVPENASLWCSEVSGPTADCKKSRCLSDHWANHGRFEGRRSALMFDAKTYLGRYPDLQKVLGPKNWAAAADHFVNYGSAKCKVGPCENRNGKP